jgi:signal transduction histidine kinase/CheY-like chemotaxis protein/CHASE3 domain sensor protein
MLRRLYKLRSSLPATQAGLALSGCALILVILLAYFETKSLSIATSERAHSRQTILLVEELLSLLKDADIGVRGFLLTHDQNFLKPYLTARINVPMKLEELAQFTRDSGDLASQVESVGGDIRDVMDFHERTLEKARSTGGTTANSLGLVRGNDLMERTRTRIKELVEYAELDLERKSTQASLRAASIRSKIFMSGLLTLLFLLLTIIQAYRREKKRALLEKKIFQANQELQKRDEFSNLIFANTRDCIKVIDDQNGLKFMNVGGQRLLEICEFEPLKNTDWVQFWKGDDQKRAQNAIAEARAGGVGHFVGFFSTLQTGTPRWFDVIVTPIPNKSGKPAELLVVSRDITDTKCADDLRKEVELAARRSEEWQRLALKAAKVGHWDWDPVRRRFNSMGGLEDLYGRSTDDPIQTADEFLEMVHPDDRLLVSNSIFSCMDDAKPYEVKFRLVWRDGSILWLHGRGKAVLNPDGKIARVAGVHIDITEQKVLEIALIEADQKKSELIISEKAAMQASEMKSMFLANMSHEIRTPISAVMGMAGILFDTELNDEQKSYVSIIRGSAESLLTLVNDILDLSKAEAGKVELENIPFALNQVASDVERTLLYTAKKKGLNLQSKISLEIPPVLLGDPTRLKQVMINLINNGIKFTSQGEVVVSAFVESTSAQGVQVVFEISDTGVGISDSAIGRLFQSFSQADTSTTRKFGGTGLGLSICKNLVELMGGKIGVRSQEGKGSTFWFSVPFQLGTSLPLAEQVVTRENSIDQKLQILVAEDNPTNQLIATKILEKFGHSATVVTNGKEAIGAIHNGKFDLILMDCQMPEVDGYEATRLIRAGKAGKSSNIPIIAMTANALTGDREKCIEAGMTDYISKPIKPKDLLAVIARAQELSKKAA